MANQPRWRKSTYSGGGGQGGGDCVELAHFPTTSAIRDSKSPHTPALHFPTPTLIAWISTLPKTDFTRP
ncbi:DUF397 domain-containing protein [Actinokineospora cianjurensis]|uniref:Uncharacterized protein DUF397 n=1 Tax=Actinokineospora cianjurensis TaxID=585224 RepID=A0A421BD38_9PSEU|nr:DUF397 domain-containing protein [Actinokineospora cianjurensis]RLK62246.1 uncharacterized protein DUF397 [Actinokineospora cianjurensis]